MKFVKLFLIAIFFVLAINAVKVSEKTSQVDRQVELANCINNAINISMEAQSNCPAELSAPRFECLAAVQAQYEQDVESCYSMWG